MKFVVNTRQSKFIVIIIIYFCGKVLSKPVLYTNTLKLYSRRIEQNTEIRETISRVYKQYILLVFKLVISFPRFLYSARFCANTFRFNSGLNKLSINVTSPWKRLSEFPSPVFKYRNVPFK